MKTNAYHASLAAMMSKQLGCKVDVAAVAAAISSAKVAQDKPSLSLPQECTEMAVRVSEIDSSIKALQAERDRLTSILDRVAYPLYEERSRDEGRFITQCGVEGASIMYCAARHMVKPPDGLPDEWVTEAERPTPKKYVRQTWFDEVHRDPSLKAHAIRPVTFFKEGVR